MAKGLGDQLRDIRKKRVMPRATLVVKKTLIDLGSAIVFDTAVAGGRARGAWVTGFGEINFSQGSADKDGGATVGKLVGDINGKFKLGEDAYYTNTLAYILPLEYGSEPGEKPWPSPGPKTTLKDGRIYPIQADDGMLAVNIAKFRPTVEKIAKELNR